MPVRVDTVPEPTNPAEDDDEVAARVVHAIHRAAGVAERRAEVLDDDVGTGDVVVLVEAIAALVVVDVRPDRIEAARQVDVRRDARPDDGARRRIDDIESPRSVWIVNPPSAIRIPLGVLTVDLRVADAWIDIRESPNRLTEHRVHVGLAPRKKPRLTRSPARGRRIGVRPDERRRVD